MTNCKDCSKRPVYLSNIFYQAGKLADDIHLKGTSNASSALYGFYIGKNLQCLPFQELHPEQVYAFSWAIVLFCPIIHDGQAQGWCSRHTDLRSFSTSSRSWRGGYVVKSGSLSAFPDSKTPAFGYTGTMLARCRGHGCNKQVKKCNLCCIVHT